MDVSHLQFIGLVPKLGATMPLDFEFVATFRHCSSGELMEYREQFSRRDLMQHVIENPELFRTKFGHHGYQLGIEILGRECERLKFDLVYTPQGAEDEVYQQVVDSGAVRISNHVSLHLPSKT